MVSTPYLTAGAGQVEKLVCDIRGRADPMSSGPHGRRDARRIFIFHMSVKSQDNEKLAGRKNLAWGRGSRSSQRRRVSREGPREQYLTKPAYDIWRKIEDPAEIEDLKFGIGGGVKS